MSLTNFKNYLLISTPGLNDSIFRKSIVLVCDHDENGAMGLIVNKSIIPDGEKSSFLKDIFTNMNINSKIYFGGPVASTAVFTYSYHSNETMNFIRNIFNINESILEDIKILDPKI